MRRLTALALAVLVGLAGLAGLAAPAISAPGAGKPGAAARVVVWPRGPSDDIAGVEAAVRAAGFTPVASGPVLDRLRALGAGALAAEAAALDALTAALAAARESYLRQDGAAMAAGLAQAEAAALPVLAEPRHVAALWELQLQRGLAELLRRDLDAARARFALALALDESRAPRRELYGPAVARAFAEVADARAQVPPRPTPLVIEPRDARVVIDGLPVIDNAAPRALRPGLHAIAAAAPGYRGHAVILEVRSGEPIRIALAPATGDAVERLGAAWAAGAADPGTDAGRRAIAAVIAELGAAAAVIVDVDPARGDAGARVLAAGEVSPAARRPAAAEAAEAVLAYLSPDGSLRRGGPEAPGGASAGGDGGTGGSNGRRASGSVLRTWWFWTAIGGVAAAGIAAGLAFDAQRGDGTGTIRVLPPAP